MPNDDKAATQTVSQPKDVWVKPEITSFAPAVEAQGSVGGPTDNNGSVS